MDYSTPAATTTSQPSKETSVDELTTTATVTMTTETEPETPAAEETTSKMTEKPEKQHYQYKTELQFPETMDYSTLVYSAFLHTVCFCQPHLISSLSIKSYGLI